MTEEERREKDLNRLAMLLHNRFCQNPHCGGPRDFRAWAEHLLPEGAGEQSLKSLHAKIPEGPITH